MKMAGRISLLVRRLLLYLIFLREINQAGSIQLVNTENEVSAFFTEHLYHSLSAPYLLDTLHAYDVMYCALKCLAVEGCLSFNFGVEPETNREHLCELLASNKYDSVCIFARSQVFHHFSITSPCVSSPCQHGGTCRVEWWEGTSHYTCDCAAGFVGEHCEQGGQWLKINTIPVTFGARDDHFGKVIIQKAGDVIAFKLVHIYGYVVCKKLVSRSYWGCPRNGKEDDLGTFITDSQNKRLLPSSFLDPDHLFYHLPGYTANSPELRFDNQSSPLTVTNGQQFRVWYGEDLEDITEHDNLGEVAFDVYGLYV